MDGLKLNEILGDKETLGLILGDKEGLIDGLILGLIEGLNDGENELPPPPAV